MKSKYKPLNSNVLKLEKQKEANAKKEEEKTKAVNNVLVNLRRLNLNFAKKDRALQAKMLHFNKMFHSVKDDDRINYIQFFLKVDNWPLNK